MPNRKKIIVTALENNLAMLTDKIGVFWNDLDSYPFKEEDRLIILHQINQLSMFREMVNQKSRGRGFKKYWSLLRVFLAFLKYN